MKIAVTLYKGLDYNSVITERVLKDLVIMLEKEYELDIEFNAIDIPLVDEASFPKIVVNEKIIVEGRIPGVDEVVDAVFDIIKEKTPLGPAGFPLPLTANTT
ncbi:MAG: hypothetical protein LRS47_04170 [Desulfurococcales archaeon]|nr:hypothetical protein [Desulfurococcales archaeon]